MEAPAICSSNCLSAIQINESNGPSDKQAYLRNDGLVEITPITVTGGDMGNRKQHNKDAGYVAERKNPYVSDKKVVIYIAAEQGIDVDGKYAVVCDAHGTMVGETSLSKARFTMKSPDSFCDGCRQLAESFW